MNIEFNTNSGYWCIFYNFDLLRPAIEAAGLDKITDSAIGAAWSRYWTANDLDSAYGERCQREGTIGWQYPEASTARFLEWFDGYLQEIKNRKEPIHRIPVLPTTSFKNPNKYTGKPIFWTGFCKEDEEVRLPQIMVACGILAGKGVSKKIDFLITGPHNSITGQFANIGKQAKARELGIPVVPTEIFISDVSL